MVTKVTPTQVKQLREATGAGFQDCRNALLESQGDVQAAIDYLRQKGVEFAAKKADRTTHEGMIEVYRHHTGGLSVIVEINCETDFVARSAPFQQFARDLSLHIANDAPLYVRREDIPQHEIRAQEAKQREKTLSEGKPSQIVDRIVAGRMEKWYQRVVLMEQSWLHDDEYTVGEIVTQLIAETRENMVIRRFARFALSETTEDET
ncbi:MAG: translation elongation factor Ts [Anaerolineaceae bacterium]|nr:translation elongation factor Ts [Anaerolineaceae bacterium]